MPSASNKRIGDIFEAQFIADCIRRNLPVAVPFGDSEQYDLIVENRKGKLVKVQVKGTLGERTRGCYKVCVSRGLRKSQYTNIDFFALYTNDHMYIIPARDIKAQAIKISPTPGTKWDKYRENWESLNSF